MREKGSVQRSTTAIAIHNCHAFRDDEMEHCLWNLNIGLPLPKAVFELHAAGLSNCDSSEPSGIGIHFEKHDLNLATCVWRQWLIVDALIIRLTNIAAIEIGRASCRERV